MTELSVAVLVSVDQRERYDVVVPGVKTPRFAGSSLSSLLDDVTLHLMESIPKASAEDMPSYDFDPYVELRKVKVEVELGDKKSRRTWKGRIAVVVTRWREDDFFLACAPRLGPERFAVRRLGELAEALKAHIEAKAEGNPSFSVEGAACWYDDFLQVLTFETDLPTILSSQPKRRGRGMRKKREKKAEARAAAEREQEKKRKLVPPTELRAVGRNLTHQALDGRLPRAYLREDLVRTVVEALEREGAAVLLVGPSGVGKTAIAAEAVLRIAEQATSMEDRREVWAVDGNRIISGMSFVGQWESRVQRLVRELSARQDVLFVEDLPGLVFAGRTSQEETNVAGYLEPHLTRKEIRVLGECTPERLLATRDEAPGFFSRFRIVHVPPMAERDTLICLAHALRARARFDDVTVSPDGLEAVLGLTRRFEPAAHDPGRSVRLLERVLSDRAEMPTDDLGRRAIGRAQITEHFARATGLPRFVLWQEEARPHDEIEAYFQRRIVAQRQAVQAAIDVVSLLEQGLNDPGRPLSSFLFVGPTGVGKTETAKALAELLFGAPDRLIRFDMSEFMAPHTVARLIGDRFSPEGELTRRVHQQPFSVVLLDEIEKAHPVIYDALLQVLGEGRLTNAAGQTVSFSNTVVIMTSNLGVREANKRVGFESPGQEELQLHYRRAAERYFRPEFFNRIDRIVPFDRLERDAIVPLVRRLLEQMLGRRGLQRNSVVVDVDPELVGVLVDEGFDARYGARSIKRILEQKLAVPLAAHLVSQHLDQLTIAELYPRGGSIEMVLSAPKRRPRPAVDRPPPAKTWDEVEVRLRAIRARLDALRPGGRADTLRNERSRLVELVESYGGDPRVERLRHLSDLFSQVEQIDEVVAVLEEQLRVPEYEERFIVKRLDDPRWIYRRGRNRGGPAFETVGTVATPVRSSRAPFQPEITDLVERLEVDVRALAFLARHLATAETQSILLSLRPVGVDPGARNLARRLGLALVRAWSEILADGGVTSLSWVSATRLHRVEGRLGCFGSLRELRDAVATPKDVHDCPLEALLLEGPGVRQLVEPELGLHLEVSELGPDLVTRLVRIDEVPGEGDPVERVEALEAGLTEYQARRRKEAIAPPLEEVPLVREYFDGVAVDPVTGERVRLGNDGDLRRVSVLRLIDEAEATP